MISLKDTVRLLKFVLHPDVLNGTRSSVGALVTTSPLAGDGDERGVGDVAVNNALAVLVGVGAGGIAAAHAVKRIVPNNSNSIFILHLPQILRMIV
jgi:hypothetical protein